MGLLDDAIREHLELKRRRGADPGEVAREQREALDPVPSAETATDDGETHPDVEAATTDASEANPKAAEPDVGSSDPAELAHDTSLANAGETAELDMSSVLGNEQAAAPLVEEDSLEWEVPAETSHDAHEAEDATKDIEPAEDVLEETPEFLRDTPEQDRLWFEQRPPRDFDFDK